MTRKRKRLGKLLMAVGVPRNRVLWSIVGGLITGLSYADMIEELESQLRADKGGDADE